MANETADDLDMQMLTGLYDAPAYIRRARGVEQALLHLIDAGNAVRAEWLDMVCLRVGILHALAGEWSALRPLLADDVQIEVLRTLYETLSPTLRLPPRPTRSRRALRRALRELIESLERFNARWSAYLRKVDRSVVNELREGYNRYYLLEKSCAIKSEAVVKMGFVPLPPLELADLERHLPPLLVPRLA